MTSPRFFRKAVFAILLATLSRPCSLSAEHLNILLDDGRMVSGAVDGRSDASRLWLRISSNNIVVASAFPRAKIVNTWQIDEPALAKSTQSSRMDLPAPEVFWQPPADSRVRWIEIQAHPANWDADAEMDGIRLLVFPVNGSGEWVSVGGTIHASLVIWSRGSNRSTRELERWSRLITAEQGRTPGLSVELPFVNLHSAYDRRVLADAMLDVRFGVPGHGAFSARVPVRLSGYSPVDDETLLRSQSVEGERPTLRGINVRRVFPRRSVPVRHSIP